MATVSKGKTFISGETVEPADMHQLVDSATVTNIVDADIGSGAAIAASKLAGTLDLSGKTVTLPDASVAQAKLAANVAGNGPAFSAYANTGTSVANGSFAKITLGVERFDTNNNFASSRFTPTVAGYYQINGTVFIESAANYLLAIVVKNGTNIPAQQWDFAFYGTYGQAATAASSVSVLVYLNGTTDYVELAGYQASGTSATISNAQTRMDGFLARAA